MMSDARTPTGSRQVARFAWSALDQEAKALRFTAHVRVRLRSPLPVYQPKETACDC